MSRAWPLRHWFVLVILIGGAWVFPASGQDPLNASAEISALRARIEALEAQNRQLRESFERLPITTPMAAIHEQAAIHEMVEHYLLQRELKPESGDHVVGSDLHLSASWNHGLEFTTPAKDFRVHVGGRTQFDAAWFSVSENLNGPPIPLGLINSYVDGVDPRRARFRIDGTMYEIMEWAAEYDFVNAARVRNAADNGPTDHTVVAFTDLWWQFKYLPLLGNVRIGNQKEPIGFEHLVSSRFLPFMERSFNQDSFYGGFFNGFTPGIQAFDTMLDERGTWAVGLFKPVDNVFASGLGDGTYAADARVTFLPWYYDEGRSLLHLGFSLRQANSINGLERFRTRSPVRAGLASQWPVPADTGLLAGDDMLWVNGELAAVVGPWTFQAEYLNSYLQDAAPLVGGVPGPSVGVAHYHGGYAQVLYFLTGENDHYNRKTGVFERVIPYENFFLVRDCDGNARLGRGAWQVGARYNYLDLNDGGLNGGILHDLTAGINWFLNPNTKLQFNYSATHRDSPIPGADGWINGWGARLAHDF